MAGSDERLVRTWRRAVEALKPPADIRRALRVDQAITDDGRVRLDRAYGPLQPENAALLDAVSVAVNAPDDLSAAVNLEDRLVAHGDAVAAIDATVDALLITPFIVQTPSAVLTAEQALSTLATGLLKNTTGTGVLSIATGADVPAHNHTSADVTDFAEAAQDAVGGILSDAGDIDFDYVDAPPAITAAVKADAITYAKMQNISATDRVLGRSTAGAGDVEEIVCTAAGRALIDDADAAAQRATLGLVAGGAGDIWVEKAGDTLTGDLGFWNGSATTLIIDEADGTIYLGGGSAQTIRYGSGSPEGAVTAPPGSMFLSSNGNIYRKGSGTGNTGWVTM